MYILKNESIWLYDISTFLFHLINVIEIKNLNIDVLIKLDKIFESYKYFTCTNKSILKIGDEYKQFSDFMSKDRLIIL